MAVSGCSTISRWQQAYSLVSDLAGSGSAEPEQREEVRYAVDGREYVADLYHPAEPARAGLVLVHGFTDLGKEDPRLREFAQSLASVRFLVLVPEIESLTRFNVSPDNVEAVRDAMSYLAGGGSGAASATGEKSSAARPLGVEAPARVGVAAISYSVGPAILAALRAHAPVDFIFAVGGYYDIVQGITFATTGYYRDGGEWRYREPASSGRWLLLLGHAHQMPEAGDGELLMQIAERKLDDPQADVDTLVSQLGEQGRAAYRLVNNRDPTRVPKLIEQLPEPMRRQIAALDLADRDLSELDARLILLHGRDDPMIPATQSEALAAAVPAEQVELFIVDGLMHVDVQPGWDDALQLWQAAVALLRARDGAER